MSTYIEYESERYALPSDCSLSIGNSCDTKERKMSDGSGTSYSLTTYHKAQVNTYSLSFVLTTAEYTDLMTELYNCEMLVGKTINFVYCNIPFKSMIVTDMSVSFGLDGVVGVTSLSISFNMKDNVVITKKSSVVNVNVVF